MLLLLYDRCFAEPQSERRGGCCFVRNVETVVHPTTNHTSELVRDVTNHSETPLLGAADSALSSFVQLGPAPPVHIWGGLTVSLAWPSVHREQSPCCCALSGRCGGDNGNPSDGFFPTCVFGQAQQEQQTDLRLLSPRGSRVQDITSLLCKKAMAVRETGPQTKIDAQRGCTYVLYIIRSPATSEASRRYQVGAIAKHQLKGLLRFIQSNEEKSRLCRDLPSRLFVYHHPNETIVPTDNHDR
jgi:hypothetical protein